jgi:hypothetical protein
MICYQDLTTLIINESLSIVLVKVFISCLNLVTCSVNENIIGA